MPAAPFATPTQVVRNFAEFPAGASRHATAMWRHGRYRHRIGHGASRLQFAALALALTSSHAYADTFQEKWMGRIARHRRRRAEASVYWKTSGTRAASASKPTRLSCAHAPRRLAPLVVHQSRERQEDPLPGSGPRPHTAAEFSTSRSAPRASRLRWLVRVSRAPCGLRVSGRNPVHFRLSPKLRRCCPG